jgi:hypothetical protein
MCRCSAVNGQREHRGAEHRASAAPRAALTRPPAQRPDVQLAYLGRVALLLKGPVSRRIYALRPDAPRLLVDDRDLSSLLASGMFEST